MTNHTVSGHELNLHSFAHLVQAYQRLCAAVKRAQRYPALGCSCRTCNSVVEVRAAEAEATQTLKAQVCVVCYLSRACACVCCVCVCVHLQFYGGREGGRGNTDVEGTGVLCVLWKL